jgi:pyruvate dehydrogenase E1 component alpha subunit
MLVKEIPQFSLRYVQLLDEKGRVDPAFDPGLDDGQLVGLYRNMLLARLFDRRAVRMQRQGRMGTYAPFEGHEALQMAGALALRRDDWLFPSYRDSAALIQRGVPMKKILLYWMGREEGNDFIAERSFPYQISVGSQMLHAVGAAYAEKLQGKDTVTLSFFGDGATSQGDFYEALNFGGVWQTPTVFVCQNNQWAISVPLKTQTRAESIAQKAIAAGIESVQVDGNDPLGVYHVVREAVERARAGEGPTLVEARTYRIAMHTTSDDPTRYQATSEVRWWEEREPMHRFRTYLEQRGLWSQAQEEAAVEKAEVEIREAVTEAEMEAPLVDPGEIYRTVYAEMTQTLRRQLGEMRAGADGEEERRG